MERDVGKQWQGWGSQACLPAPAAQVAGKEHTAEYIQLEERACFQVAKHVNVEGRGASFPHLMRWSPQMNIAGPWSANLCMCCKTHTQMHSSD
eukprot:1008128-Pelagomonas_calceolata.AAC.1